MIETEPKAPKLPLWQLLLVFIVGPFLFMAFGAFQTFGPLWGIVAIVVSLAIIGLGVMFGMRKS